MTSGPPWILGHRGSPTEAPENTLVSLRRALDLGLDGVEYDLQPCATGEPVLLHDETLDRTTDGSGPVRTATLPEITGLEAGSWFDPSFRGEPLPLLEEALELGRNSNGDVAMHMIELKDPTLVSEVARELRSLSHPLSVRIASFHRSVCLEARDLGLETMLIATRATESDRVFVRDERISAYATAPGGWEASAAPWSCEQWSWAVDHPEDLLDACRRPLFGFNTNRPRRALATRELVRMTPEDDGPFPLRVPLLEVPEPHVIERGGAVHGEWSGSWNIRLQVRNPFGFGVRAALALQLHGGAFQVAGLPVLLRLRPGERAEVPLSIEGGSWSPGNDPVIQVWFEWEAGPGRAGGAGTGLLLDHPLERVRSLHLGEGALRLPMLREHPGAPPASAVLERKGDALVLSVEDPGDVADARAILRLGHVVRVGGHGVRIPLPADLESLDANRSLLFSAGFEGRSSEGERVLRRWCGGLPYGLRSGAPGRLFLRRS